VSTWWGHAQLLMSTIALSANQITHALPAIGKSTLCGTALFVAYESAHPAPPSSTTAWTFAASSSAGSPTYWIPESSLGRVAVAGFAAGAAQGACEVAWDLSGVFARREAKLSSWCC